MERVADDMAAGYKMTVNESETITATQAISGYSIGGHATVLSLIERS
jgi:hypothetical protein